MLADVVTVRHSEGIREVFIPEVDQGHDNEQCVRSFWSAQNLKPKTSSLGKI